jgi:hypothetical protein
VADNTSHSPRTPETPGPEAPSLFYGYDELRQDAWREADVTLAAFDGRSVLHWLTLAYAASQRQEGRRRPLDLAELIIAAGHLAARADDPGRCVAADPDVPF